MRNKRIALLVPAGLLFFLLFIPLNHAITDHFVEDFTTTEYRDGGYTNAWWDTEAGELTLRTFDMLAVGSYDTPGGALGVAVDGDWAYLADGGEGLVVFDISNASSDPAWVGEYDTPGDAWAVVPAGDYVYVADNVTGLLVIDVSTPSSPSLAGSYDTPGSAYDVKIAGDYAYVADGTTGGLQIVDISDPTVPVSAGSCNTSGGAISIDLAGDYAFIADRGEGLVVLDISDPTNPGLADTYDTPGDCWGVAVSGDYAFLGDALSGIHVIDVSDPTNVTHVRNYDQPGSHRRLFVDGDYLYSAAYDRFYEFDISDPNYPFTAEWYGPTNTATTVVVDGEYAYVADGSGGGLRVFKVANSFQPVRIGRLDPQDRANSVFVAGDLAYVAESGAGGELRIVDIWDPVEPNEIGSYGASGEGVFVTGDQAFLASGSAGLIVIDVSDPSTPTYLGSYDTFESALGVFVSGDYAFVALNFDGLNVFDVTDPTNPTPIGTYVTPDRAYGVVVTGDHAFVASGSGGLQVIDVTSPSTPSFVGSYDTSGSARAVAVAGDYAFVADAAGGFAVIDISNPSSPVLADQLATGAWAVSVAVTGNYAFVGTGSSILQVDIQDPTSLSLVGEAPIEDYARGLFIWGDLLAVADSDDGMDIFRVFHRRFTAANRARSLPINDTQDTIVRTLLTTTQVDSVWWEMSADGGGEFDTVIPGEWERLVPGSSLIWRSTLFPITSSNPKCTQLNVDWLFDFPLIESIVDVPGDGGGSVELRLRRSGYDFAAETETPVEKYVVWRRFQDVSTGIDLSSNNQPMNLIDLPPGTWEPIDSFPTAQQPDYVVSVPTVSDSGDVGAEPTVFVVSVHGASPSVWFVSPPDSGYSRDDVPPSPPTGLTAAYNTGWGNHLSWDACPDPDFHYYWIYHGNTEDFVTWPENRVHNTTLTDWYDPLKDGWPVYYKVTAVDRAGNESAASSPVTVSGIGRDVVPARFALYQNTPNPFNPATEIHFDVPAGGGKVSIKVYDVAGRLVRTLVNGGQAPGRWSATWDGRDDGGARVASGVYFCRMTAAGFTMTHKMVFLQ